MTKRSSSFRNAPGFERLRLLAREHGNCSLTLVPPHKNPYRDYSADAVQLLEKQARENLKAAIIQDEIHAMLSATADIQSGISTAGVKTEMRRGNVWKFVIQNVAWIDENWKTFAGPFEPKSRRKIHLFLRFDAVSLQKLVSEWYDPNVLTNASVASSPRALSAIKKCLEPGVLAFSISLFRLRSCQLYFYPKNVEEAVDVICEAAQKTEWWWKMIDAKPPA